jgi:hypothetical protein
MREARSLVAADDGTENAVGTHEQLEA